MDQLHPAMVLALQPFAPPQAVTRRYIPPESINQDDWYVFDATTHELAYVLGSKYRQPEVKPGQRALRGMSLAHNGVHLWKVVRA